MPFRGQKSGGTPKFIFFATLTVLFVTTHKAYVIKHGTGCHVLFEKMDGRPEECLAMLLSESCFELTVPVYPRTVRSSKRGADVL